MRESVGESQSHPQHQRWALHRVDEPISYARKHPIAEVTEPRHQEAADLAVHKEVASEPPTEQPPEDLLVDPTVNASLGQLPNLRPQIEGDRSFLNEIKIGYTKDPLCSKVLDNVEHYKTFEVQDGLIYTHNRADESVLCIPSVLGSKGPKGATCTGVCYL